MLKASYVALDVKRKNAPVTVCTPTAGGSGHLQPYADDIIDTCCDIGKYTSVRRWHLWDPAPAGRYAPHPDDRMVTADEHDHLLLLRIHVAFAQE